MQMIYCSPIIHPQGKIHTTVADGSLTTMGGDIGRDTGIPWTIHSYLAMFPQMLPIGKAETIPMVTISLCLMTGYPEDIPITLTVLSLAPSIDQHLIGQHQHPDNTTTNPDLHQPIHQSGSNSTN